MATSLNFFRGISCNAHPYGSNRPKPLASKQPPTVVKPASALVVPRHWVLPEGSLPGRASLRVASSDTGALGPGGGGADGDDQLVGEQGQVLQGKQEKPTSGAGMGSEEMRADMPAQGGAPEGDMAAAGQETQLTGQPTGEGGSQPDAGDKMPDTQGKDASQVASEEARQQEDRAPLQD